MPEFRLSTFDNKRKRQHQMLFLHEFSVKLRWFCICKLVICIYEGYDLHWTFNPVEINTTVLMYVETAWFLLVCKRNQWSVLSVWFFMRPDKWNQRKLTFDVRTGQTAKAYDKSDLPDESLRSDFDRIHEGCQFQIQSYYHWLLFTFWTFDIFVLFQ